MTKGTVVRVYECCQTRPPICEYHSYLEVASTAEAVLCVSGYWCRNGLAGDEPERKRSRAVRFVANKSQNIFSHAVSRHLPLHHVLLSWIRAHYCSCMHRRDDRYPHQLYSSTAVDLSGTNASYDGGMELVKSNNYVQVHPETSYPTIVSSKHY